MNRERRKIILLLAACAVLHLALLLPGINSGNAAAFFSRPDSSGYVGPALALVADGAFLDRPGGIPFAGRAPGMAFFLAGCFAAGGDGHAGFMLAAALLSLSGVAAVLLVYLAARKLFPENAKIALAAALLYALHPTILGNAPMLLSDTLFGVFAAGMLYCYAGFLRGKSTGWFLASVAVAAAGALIRPINYTWIWPALFCLAAARDVPWRRKLVCGAAALAIFFAILAPWMLRNRALGAGCVIDTNTGAMYHQNGAMLLAKVNGTEYEVEKQKILAELEVEFSDRARYPDEKTKVDYRLKRFKELVLAHPLAWLPQHFQWRILLPDLPALCESLNLTRSDRGTLNILQRDGFFAAMRHYFGPHGWWLPLFFAPLLLTAGLTLAGFAGYLAIQLRHPVRNYEMLLAILLFIEYNFFLPGPMTLPRYQIPALPLLAILAAAFFLRQKRRMVKSSGFMRRTH